MVTTMMPESHVVLAAGNVESNPLVSFAWIMAAAVMAPLISWATGNAYRLWYYSLGRAFL